MIKKIISGGQTGAARAALDVSIKLKIPHGGWVPKGRLAEDGSIHTKYQLQEMPTESTKVPKTVDEVVNFLISKLNLKDKSTIALMSEDDLTNLPFTFGLFIRNRFLYPRNDKLLESCREIARDKYLHWDQAASIIIRELWKKLQINHKLRVVK